MTSSHNEESSQASLAELVLSDQLTPDEYFRLVHGTVNQNMRSYTTLLNYILHSSTYTQSISEQSARFGH